MRICLLVSQTGSPPWLEPAVLAALLAFIGGIILRWKSGLNKSRRIREAIRGDLWEINKLRENRGAKLKEIRESLSKKEIHPELIVPNRIVEAHIDDAGILHEKELKELIPYYYNATILDTILKKSDEESLTDEKIRRAITAYNIMITSAKLADDELKRRNTLLKRIGLYFNEEED